MLVVLRLHFRPGRGGVFGIHFTGVGYFFWAGTGLPLMVFGPTVALEFALLAVTVYHFLGVGPAVSRH